MFSADSSRSSTPALSSSFSQAPTPSLADLQPQRLLDLLLRQLDRALIEPAQEVVDLSHDVSVEGYALSMKNSWM